MKNLKYILLLIITLNLSKDKQCFSQNKVENNILDSLKIEINKTNIEDTTYVDLLLKIGKESYANKISYWDSIAIIAEKKISTNTIPVVKNKLKLTLSDILERGGAVYYQQVKLKETLKYFLKSLKIREEINDKKELGFSYINLSFVYSDLNELDTALEYCHKSLSLFKEINAEVEILQCYGRLASIYEEKGNIYKSLDYNFKKLEIEKEKKMILKEANTLNNIASTFKRQGKIVEALEYHSKSLKISEENNDMYGKASSFNNIGTIYLNQNNNKQALKHFFKAYKIYEETKDIKGTVISLNNISETYRLSGELDSALKYQFKSLKIKEKIDYKKGIATSFNNLGLIYFQQGDTNKSGEYYLKSLNLRKKINDKYGICSSLNNLGANNFDKGNLKIAKKYTLRSLQISQELGFPHMTEIAAELLSKIYKKEGKGLKALEMYQLSITMKDSLSNKSTQKATAQQQAKCEYEKKKALDDAYNDKQLAIEREAKAKQKVITIAIGVGLGLVVVFLVFVFNRLQVTKKQKVVIEEQKRVVEIQKQEVEEAHKEITDSINYAERIQRSFLATSELLNKNLNDHFVFFQPKEAVSGDFYWAGELANGNFAMVNADSTGHGVPGAIMSILNISSIEKAIEKGQTKPSEIFNDTRATIINRLKNDGSDEGGKDGMDASIICFDFENNKFTYAAAQNPIWIIRDKEVIQIKAEKMPVGKHDHDHIPFEGGEFETKKGDQVYTLTDGFQDQFGGPKGKKFMIKKMRDYVLSVSHLPMQEQHIKIKDTFNNWKGDLEQIDDVCVIGVRI